MKQSTIYIAVITLLIGGIGGYFVTASGNDHYRDGKMQNGMGGAHPMPDDNMAGMDHGAMMVTSEREFVTGMIPHHQEAVDAAKEVLARGGATAEVRTLATEIIAAQETEIATLKEWHLAWYGEAYTAGNSYKPMMRELSDLSGAALDKQFLEDMIPHHRGAIVMAESARPYITHQEITNMANAIMTTQTAEIELMQRLLKTLAF